MLYDSMKELSPFLIGVTMNTYTHLGLEDATDELRRVEELNRAREEIAKAAEKNKNVTQLSFRAI